MSNLNHPDFQKKLGLLNDHIDSGGPDDYC